MSDSVIFDTHEFVKGAIDAGFEPTEAEYLARQASRALKTNLVTKDDLHTEIITAKFDLLKWIIMALIAQAGLVVALVKLL